MYPNSVGFRREIPCCGLFLKTIVTCGRKLYANDGELLALVYFLKRFRCYLEGSSFEVITDNQVLKHFLSKPQLSRREARWLDFFAHFRITTITLKPGKAHVLGDVLSRAPHAPSLPEIWRTTETPDEQVRVRQLMPLFILNNGRLFYDQKLCVPRKSVKQILELAHDTRVGGHFGFNKTLAILENFHWKHKLQDVRNYCKGCQRIFCDHYICGPLFKTSSLCSSKDTDSAPQAAKAFFENMFRLHRLLDSVDWDELLVPAEFSYNSARIANLSMTPFEIDLGWSPKSPLDCLSGAAV
eukprot:IDg23620t1